MFEIPVNEKKHGELTEFFNGTKDFVFFQAESITEGVLLDNSVFLMCHGTTEGHLVLGDNAFEVNESLLQFLVRKLKLESRGITNIVYNACHGGMNEDVVWGEYSLRCMHGDVEETAMRIDRDDWADDSSQPFVSVFAKNINWDIEWDDWVADNPLRNHMYEQFLDNRWD